MAGPSPQSCSECRKAKRKCSGDVPSCDRCQKQGRQCEYPSKTTHGADEAKQSVDGCAFYFLDADFFVRKGISITGSKFNDMPTELLNSVHEIIRTTNFDLGLY